MKIYCHSCNTLVGDILAGSKLKRGLAFLCPDCLEVYAPENVEPLNDSTNDGLDYLKKMFGMK